MAHSCVSTTEIFPKTIDAVIKPYVWGKNRHKLAWRLLKNPSDLAGTALPDFGLYYLASQLSQLFRIDETDRNRFTLLLCPAWAQLTTDPICNIAAGVEGITKKEEHNSLLNHYRKIWRLASIKLDIPTHNDYSPIWHNKTFQEFLTVPDSEAWCKSGIFYLSHLLTAGTLKTFDALKLEFVFPNRMFLRFLQVRHAIHSQFPESLPNPAHNPIMDVVKSEDPQKLIEIFYNMLHTPSSMKIAYNIKIWWEGDLGNLEDEDWNDALHTCKAVSPKLSDRLTQIYILYRTYLTPIRMAKFNQGQPSTCLLCNRETSTLYHLLWSCPYI